MSTIAQIHFNEKWFFHSGNMAKWYVDRAKDSVANIPDAISRRELISMLDNVSNSCQYLLDYHDNVERFRMIETTWLLQKLTKILVIMISNWNMSLVHSWISHQLQTAHSYISWMLKVSYENKQNKTPQTF